MKKVRDGNRRGNAEPAGFIFQRPKPDWKKWQSYPHVAVWEALALSCNREPDFEECEIACASFELGNTTPGLDEYILRLGVVMRHIGSGTLPLEKRPGDRDSPPLYRMVDPMKFAAWAEGLVHPWKLPKDFPRPKPQDVKSSAVQHAGQNSSWPWGTYKTELLGHLAAAVQEFWTKYDPAKPLTAPTNDVVIAWLRGRKVRVRTAQIIAKIIRADDAPRGPRPRTSSDED